MKRNRLLSILLVLTVLFSSIQIGLAADQDNKTNYSMVISLDTKEHTVEVDQNVKFTNTYNTDLKELVFHLYPDSYKSYETLPAIGGMHQREGEELPKLTEKEIGYIKIKDVTINGKKAKYTDANQILNITMEKPLKTGQDVDVRIKYIVKIPEGYQRLQYNDGIYSLTNWYPILSIYDEETKKWDENPYHPIGESNYSDVADYNVKITVPKKMVVAPTGTIIEEKENAEDKTLTIKAENVRDFVIIMSEKYKVKTKEVDGIKISSYYINNSKAANMLLNEVAKTVKFMNKTVGKYAYDELRIAETFLGGGAMEYPQVIQMGNFHEEQNFNIEENAPFLIEAAVHETIHQWFYVGVGNNEFKEPFLDESLTVFTTAYYFENQYGKYHDSGVVRKIRGRMYGPNIKPLNSGVDKFSDWGSYSEVIYSKGPAFFEDLRQRVGEEKFKKILENYYEKYLFKNATIEGLLDVIGEVAGEDIKKTMKKAVTEANYFPENIQLTEEEQQMQYRNMRKRDLKRSESENGLVIGSILLRGLEDEKTVLVKSSFIREEDLAIVEEFIKILTDSYERDLGLDIKIVEEKNLTEDDKKENLILIGYPKKTNIIKEMSPNLPINLNEDVIKINEVSIKNENITGTFISENPYNNKKLSLIVFLDENCPVEQTYEIDEKKFVISNSVIRKYNPLYNNYSHYSQFMINTKGIEINGMYNSVDYKSNGDIPIIYRY